MSDPHKRIVKKCVNHTLESPYFVQLAVTNQFGIVHLRSSAWYALQIHLIRHSVIWPVVSIIKILFFSSEINALLHYITEPTMYISGAQPIHY